MEDTVQSFSLVISMGVQFLLNMALTVSINDPLIVVLVLFLAFWGETLCTLVLRIDAAISSVEVGYDFCVQLHFYFNPCWTPVETVLALRCLLYMSVSQNCSRNFFKLMEGDHEDLEVFRLLLKVIILLFIILLPTRVDLYKQRLLYPNSILSLCLPGTQQS